MPWLTQLQRAFCCGAPQAPQRLQQNRQQPVRAAAAEVGGAVAQQAPQALAPVVVQPANPPQPRRPTVQQPQYQPQQSYTPDDLLAFLGNGTCPPQHKATLLADLAFYTLDGTRARPERIRMLQALAQHLPPNKETWLNDQPRCAAYFASAAVDLMLTDFDGRDGAQRTALAQALQQWVNLETEYFDRFMVQGLLRDRQYVLNWIETLKRPPPTLVLDPQLVESLDQLMHSTQTQSVHSATVINHNLLVYQRIKELPSTLCHTSRAWASSHRPRHQ